MNSLDPRVNRLPKISGVETMLTKPPLDQLGTFEVFVQPKDGKPFQHEGCVHASDIEMAYVFAKEAFTRRFVCTSLYVVDTKNIIASPFSEGQQSAYDLLPGSDTPDSDNAESYEVYHLLKRGKQHFHIGKVTAGSSDIFQKAKQTFTSDKPVYNIWCIKTKDIRFTSDEEMDLWNTLPEKKFRDASDYKGGDKLKSFLEEQSKHSV